MVNENESEIPVIKINVTRITLDQLVRMKLGKLELQ